MSGFICFLLAGTARSSGNILEQSNKEISRKSQDTFFQGTKLFCSYYRKTKYRVFIKGYNVSIIKNGKIYSNDALEKGNKMLAGKVYLFKNNTLRVLTSEGGEYDEFTDCK